MTTQRGYRKQSVALLPGDTLRIKQDSWVEVTSFGAAEPEYVLAQDGREATIAQAKAEYVHDRIDLEELEWRIEAALRGWLINTRQAISYYESQSPFPQPKMDTVMW